MPDKFIQNKIGFPFDVLSVQQQAAGLNPVPSTIAYKNTPTTSSAFPFNQTQVFNPAVNVPEGIPRNSEDIIIPPISPTAVIPGNVNGSTVSTGYKPYLIIGGIVLGLLYLMNRKNRKKAVTTVKPTEVK